jgi:predicted transcriptional regulator
MKDYLELETRRKIYDLIVKNPGLHLSKISSLLNIRKSLIEYHLLYMEKNQILSSLKEVGYTRYYIAGETGSREKKFLSIMRQELPLRIVLYLLKNSNVRHKEILENFAIAPSTLSYHLKKLVDGEIIMVSADGEEKRYIVKDEKETIGLLIRYKPFNLFDSFQDVWKDLQVD